MNRIHARAKRRLLGGELLEKRLLLAAEGIGANFFSPGPTVLPGFSASSAALVTAPRFEDAVEQHAEPEEEFPVLNETDEDGVTSEAPLTNADTFRLHSNPGSNHTIYLDFDGGITEGTSWNNSTGITTLIDIAYNRSGSSSSFSNSELAEIRNIWKLVAEDFAPFDVNVTTEDPGVEALRKSGSGDTQWGIRSLHTSNTNGVCSSCGGVAYVGSFSSSTDLPAYSFNKGVSAGGNTQSHEVGHTVRLSHDGLSSGTTYYNGHGSGNTTWGPIMGGPGGRKLKTWSNGDYFNANNQQDDLDRISTLNGFSYRADQHGNTFAIATPLQITDGTDLSAFGIIEQSNDVDVFSFETAGGNVSFDIDPYVANPNLDVWAGIYDSTGTLIAESNPSNNVRASFTDVPLASGKYFLKVDGVGTHGFYNSELDKVFDPGEDDYTGPETETPWAVSGPAGYSDYASIGQYWITGTREAATTDLIEIQALDSVKAEGTAGSTPFTFEISRTGSTAEEIEVAFQVITSTPDADNNNHSFSVTDEDFVGGALPSGIATIAAGDGSVILTLDVAGDADFERDEFFQVLISDATTGWTITESTADGTILTDESSVGIASLNTAMIAQEEGNPASGAVYTYTLVRNGDATGTTTADWEVQYDGFASPASDSDFVGGLRPSGEVTFAPGVREIDVDVQVSGDFTVESDESFRIVVTDVSGDGATFVDPATPSRRGIILEDEVIINVIDDVQFRWRQIRNGSGTRDAWAIDNVSLSASNFGDDFDPDVDNTNWASIQNGSVNTDESIFPGENEQELLMRGTGDRIATTIAVAPTAGSTLTFDLIIGNGVNNNGADNAESGKDVWLEFSVDGQNWEVLEKLDTNDYEQWQTVNVALPSHVIVTPGSVDEGNTASSDRTVNLVRGGKLNKTISVDWQVLPSGANPIDHADVTGIVFPSGTVSFDVDERVRVVTIPIAGDGDIEPDETFEVIAITTDGFVTGGPRSLTVVNDDFPGVESVVINDGLSPQRSVLKEVHVVFDGLVDAPPTAFALTNTGTVTAPANAPVAGVQVVMNDNVDGKTVATLSLLSGASLDDGNYRLDITATLIVERDGSTLMADDYSFGDDEADAFFRKFGDADGNRFVNLSDFASLRATFGKGLADPDFDPTFDSDGNDAVNLVDFAAFRGNFGT